jgi:hypothetical protein
MDLKQRISFIKKHLLDGNYTIVAKECLAIIEFTFRELLLHHLDVLDADTQLKIQKEESNLAKGGRGKSIQDFTMGQLLGIIRETDFVGAWGRATGKDFLNIHMINLDTLNAVRNHLIHQNKEVNYSQAHFIFCCLQLIVESFDMASLEQEIQTKIQVTWKRIHTSQKLHIYKLIITLTNNENTAIDSWKLHISIPYNIPVRTQYIEQVDEVLIGEIRYVIYEIKGGSILLGEKVELIGMGSTWLEYEMNNNLYSDLYRNHKIDTIKLYWKFYSSDSSPLEGSVPWDQMQAF